VFASARVIKLWLYTKQFIIQTRSIRSSGLPCRFCVQERAYVTGLAAANMVVSTLGVGQAADILPTEADEAHIVAGRLINRTVKSAAQALGVKSPFLF
jgi:hypothetical protein